MSDVTKNSYLANIEITKGGAQNRQKVLVSYATDQADAGVQAIEGLLHDEPNWVSEIECFDMDGEINYRVISCTPVPEADAVVLAKYL